MYPHFPLNKDELMELLSQEWQHRINQRGIKRKFKETSKSKNRTTQIIKLLAKIIAYILRVVIHKMYENRIEPSFLSPIK